MEDIIREGNPLLRKTAKEVSLPPSDEEKTTLLRMLDFIINSQDPDIAEKYELRSSIGLAAPQIGLLKRMFVMHVTDEKDKLTSFGIFNPKIVSHSIEETYLENGEGCLSVDRPIPGIVPRYARITMKGIDIDGEKTTMRLKGLPAIVAQHEIDHLNGILFYDRIPEFQDELKVALST